MQVLGDSVSADAFLPTLSFLAIMDIVTGLGYAEDGPLGVEHSTAGQFYFSGTRHGRMAVRRPGVSLLNSKFEFDIDELDMFKRSCGFCRFCLCDRYVVSGAEGQSMRSRGSTTPRFS